MISRTAARARRIFPRFTDHTRSKRASRAQSETVGVILLTAVIVILVSGFGVVYLGVLDDRAAGQGPLLDANVTVTGDSITITHVSGESVRFDELEVIVRTDGTDHRFAMDAENVSKPGSDADAGDRFDPGERFRRVHDLAGGQVEVLLVHTASNEVLHRTYADVSTANGE